VKKQNLPMATTSLNIVQRLGGPILTTLCATFLRWRLATVYSDATLARAFVLLCVFHALLFVAALNFRS